MGITGQHEQRWWHKEGVRYWYALGIAFMLVGVAQTGIAVARDTGVGSVLVGVAYLLISATWLAVGRYKRYRQLLHSTRD